MLHPCQKRVTASEPDKLADASVTVLKTCITTFWASVGVRFPDSACRPSSPSSSNPRTMAFTLPTLGYGYDSLEPYIDSTTMNIHHTKHHQAYINNVNGALESSPGLKDLDLVSLNKAVGTDKIPAELATKVRNNGGGHLNHSFFWKVMTSPSNTNGASGDLKAAIDAAFGSVDQMQAQFNAAAAGRFGSGWAWLGCKEDGTLTVTSTPNQDNPLMACADTPCIPVLGLDVWEHAYYLKYQNRRPEYIAAFWNVVNWEQVTVNYEEAKQGKFSV